MRNPDEDSDEDISSDSSTNVAPLPRRSKFDDEEDDSDVCLFVLSSQMKEISYIHAGP